MTGRDDRPRGRQDGRSGGSSGGREGRRPGGLSKADRMLWERLAATVTPLRRIPRGREEGEGSGGGEDAANAGVEGVPAPVSAAEGKRATRVAPEAGRAPQRTTAGPASRIERARPPGEATLDGGWDRRIRSGAIRPDLVLDLHGYTQEQARTVLRERLAAAAFAGGRVALVITGKGRSGRDDDADGGVRGGVRGGRRDRVRDGAGGHAGRGVLRASLPRWLEEDDLRPLVAALRPAHPRHGGSGAWYVVLKRLRDR